MTQMVDIWTNKIWAFRRGSDGSQRSCARLGRLCISPLPPERFFSDLLRAVTRSLLTRVRHCAPSPARSSHPQRAASRFATESPDPTRRHPLAPLTRSAPPPGPRRRARILCAASRSATKSLDPVRRLQVRNGERARILCATSRSAMESPDPVRRLQVRDGELSPDPVRRLQVRDGEPSPDHVHRPHRCPPPCVAPLTVATRVRARSRAASRSYRSSPSPLRRPLACALRLPLQANQMNVVSSDLL